MRRVENGNKEKPTKPIERHAHRKTRAVTHEKKKECAAELCIPTHVNKVWG